MSEKRLFTHLCLATVLIISGAILCDQYPSDFSDSYYFAVEAIFKVWAGASLLYFFRGSYVLLAAFFSWFTWAALASFCDEVFSPEPWRASNGEYFWAALSVLIAYLEYIQFHPIKRFSSWLKQHF